MLLSEELALVALDPESGRTGFGTRSELEAALAGLMVAELVLGGHASISPDGRKVKPGAAPPASPVLAAAFRVVSGRGPRIKAVLSAMDGGLGKELGAGTWDTAVGGLVAAGVLAPAAGRVRPSHAIIDRAAREAALARLQAAARGEDDDNIRTAALLSMTGPAHLLERVVPRRGDRREGRRRIDHALDGNELSAVGKAVRSVIRDAASAAAGAATVAVAGSS
jgi:hypothetical protein